MNRPVGRIGAEADFCRSAVTSIAKPMSHDETDDPDRAEVRLAPEVIAARAAGGECDPEGLQHPGHREAQGIKFDLVEAAVAAIAGPPEQEGAEPGGPEHDHGGEQHGAQVRP